MLFLRREQFIYEIDMLKHVLLVYCEEMLRVGELISMYVQ
jgi:hypothetical protein